MKSSVSQNASVNTHSRGLQTKHKLRLVQACYGAIILSLLMTPIAIIGYAPYIWMLFLPLMLFFAFGADFKRIPSMIASYLCGIGWALLNGVILKTLGPVLDPNLLNMIAPMIIVFGVLTVHENFLGGTIVGNVPALFMGLATTFFTTSIIPANASPITSIHLVGFFLYGTLMAVILAGGGFAICSKIFGKETTIQVLTNQV